MNPVPTSPSNAPVSRLVRVGTGLWAGAKSFIRYFEGVLGADKYRVYLQHQARTHPGIKPMNEREFWKDYTDWQEKNPQGRCC